MLEVDLGSDGGIHRFRSVEDVVEWTRAEAEHWQWTSVPGDRFGVWAHVQNRLNWLRDNVRAAVANGQLIEQQAPVFRQVFIEGDIALHSAGSRGARVIQIAASEGATAGLAAYAFAANRVTLQQIRTPEETRGALLIAFPGLISTNAVSEDLQRERRNLRDRADRLIEKLEMQEGARQADFVEDRRRGRAIAFRWGRRRFSTWQRKFEEAVQLAAKTQADFLAQRQQIQSDFDELESAFLEAMRLQAPAAYWRTKADGHAKAERSAQLRLLWYFPVSLLGLILAFSIAGWYLLNYPPQQNMTALYFLVSGGLGMIAAVTFWIGRLLTKLYLSEHHLRVDAEEREIMTTTYLALTKDKAASDADRQIILAALFRSAPDGIVKDDGAGDMNLAMLLSRFGIPTK